MSRAWVGWLALALIIGTLSGTLWAVLGR